MRKGEAEKEKKGPQSEDVFTLRSPHPRELLVRG